MSMGPLILAHFVRLAAWHGKDTVCCLSLGGIVACRVDLHRICLIPGTLFREQLASLFCAPRVKRLYLDQELLLVVDELTRTELRRILHIALLALHVLTYQTAVSIRLCQMLLARFAHEEDPVMRL